jgi:dethiobiotin synthetase
MHGYFIAGTDTGVGKTRVTAGLAAGFRAAGLTVAAAKPVSTGAASYRDGKISPDLELIASFSHQNPLDRRASPYVFDPAVSPHIAADRAGISIDIADICQLARALGSESQVTLVEGTGGWFAPISDTATMADIATMLGLPVILVVGLRLGCLNHALLTARAIASSGLPMAGWIGNVLDPEMLELQANVDTLRSRLDAEALAVLPHDASINSALPPLRAAAQRLLKSASRPSDRL